MARFDPSGAVGRLARAAANAKWTDKAKHAAETLKAEYAAGKLGDDAPAAHIWGTPKEQLDVMLRLIRDEQPAAAADDADEQAAAPGAAAAEADDTPDRDAEEVAAALRGVDCAGVRAATAERGSEVAAAMKTMAQQVDWSRVQPVAAQVSSALIAAVASGRIGVGGPLGSTLARTLIGQQGMADRVAKQFQRADDPMPPDFRAAIEASSREL